MFEQFNMQHVELSGGGYGYFNYAVLHCSGVLHLLDTMRYERAFFARRSDVDMLIEAAANYSEWANRRLAILLGKYDHVGKTKASWTPQRLLSNQELEIVTDPGMLLQLNADELSMRPPKKLKIRHTLPVEGPAAWVLDVMHRNKAMPSEESHAHALERAFYDPSASPAIDLTNFCATKTVWNLPPNPIDPLRPSHN